MFLDTKFHGVVGNFKVVFFIAFQSNVHLVVCIKIFMPFSRFGVNRGLNAGGRHNNSLLAQSKFTSEAVERNIQSFECVYRA